MVEKAAAIPKRRPLFGAFFMLSDNYIKSANILNAKVGELKRDVAPNLEETKRDVAPAIIMCMSFSIEMLLKCLLVVDNDEIRTKQDLEKAGIKWKGHNYLALFDRIVRPYQEVVRRHLARHDSSIHDVESVRSFLRRIGTDPFTIWRYFYEQDSIPEFRQEAFKAFGGSLRKAVLEIRSGLRWREAEGRVEL